MPLWLSRQPLILASASATRKAILDGAGVPVEVRPAAIDERALEDQLMAAAAKPADVAAHLAQAKALAISMSAAGRLVLGADQVLNLDGRLFAKPVSIAAARQHLEALSGRSHELLSAVCLALDGRPIFEAVATARLRMRPLSDAFIDAYLDVEGKAVCASVGAYRLEGLGAHLFERVEGDHTTVLGLPLLTLLPALRQFGYCLG